MAKVSVPIARSNKVAQVENGATVGATIGVNLKREDGSLVTEADLAGSTASAEDDGNGGNSFLLWEFLREVPANVTALQNASGTGLFAVTGDGTGALRTLAASADLTLSNPAGLTGNPTFGLADLANTGTGAALLKITRDSKGRLAGTSAATTSDLAEGTNLYYTDARADARITAQKGLANGLAPLGSDGKLSTDYLPAAVLGQVSYQGTWDASAGTPPTSMPEKGWYYIITVAGSTALDGITDWKVGDWAIYNGSAWNKVDNTDAVVTVNGYTGAVTLTAADVGAATAAQGALADSAVQPGDNVSSLTNDAGFLTDAPSDGSQYARKDGAWAVVAGGGGSGDVMGPASATDSGVALFDGTTGKLLKDGGSFGALVRTAVLTGLSTATNAVIAATDTVLGALGKLQAQITDNLLPKGYIDGLQMQWVSGTALTVTSGAAYIEGSGKVLRATSAIAKSGLVLSASTWYHVYLYDNAGTPDVEITTTAPAAPYNGTARSKTGDSSRRYVGSVRTDSSGNLFGFRHVGSFVEWVVPYYSTTRVVSNGMATTPTTVDVSAYVPSSALSASLKIDNRSTGGGALNIYESLNGTYSITNSSVSGASVVAPASVGSGRSIQYAFSVAPTTNGAYIDVVGYQLER